jgi:Na+-transporting methylmalonyl-CoA/oxaloacetate decarboxylase beta subunit
MNYLSFFKIFTIITFFSLGLANEAHAYIDPGTVSIIMQGLIAALVGRLVFIKTYWRKLRIFFSKKKENSSALDKGYRDE